MIRWLQQNSILVGIAIALVANTEYDVAMIGVTYCALAMAMLAIPWRHTKWQCADGSRERTLRNTLSSLRVATSVLVVVVAAGSVGSILCLRNANSIMRGDVADFIRGQPDASWAQSQSIGWAGAVPEGIVIGVKTPGSLIVAGLEGLQKPLFRAFEDAAFNIGWYALVMIGVTLAVMYLTEIIFDVTSKLQGLRRD